MAWLQVRASSRRLLLVLGWGVSDFLLDKRPFTPDKKGSPLPKILNTWWVQEGQIKGPYVVEITRQGEDGIFRRVTNYTLDREAEDVLRTLREIAAELTELDKNGNNNSKL